MQEELIFSMVADELKGNIEIAAMDLTFPGNDIVAGELHIEGFPTLLYFQKGMMLFRYSGKHEKVSQYENLNSSFQCNIRKCIELQRQAATLGCHNGMAEKSYWNCLRNTRAWNTVVGCTLKSCAPYARRLHWIYFPSKERPGHVLCTL